MSKNIRILPPSFSYRSSLKSPPTLQTLLKSGFSPTLQDFNNFLTFLCRARKFRLLIHFFPQINSHNIKPNSQTHSIFAWALLKEHKYEEAEQLVKTHMAKSFVLQQNRIWDGLIQGFCNNRSDPEKALSLLRDWVEIDGILPSSFTFCSLIRSFCLQGKMDEAIGVLEMMSKIKYPFDVFVCSWVISRLCRIGKPELAIEFFKKGCNLGGLRSSVVIYTAVTSAYCRLGKVEDVSEFVSRMEKEGLAFDAVFYSNWIDGYFKEGVIREALQIYRGMVEKKIVMDTIGYTILIDGFSKEGNVEKAVGFLHRMQKNGLVPDLVTYTAIMLGFSKKGKLEEAFAILKIVEDLGIKVDEFVYAILIDGLCKRGDFDRVFHMLEDMEKKGIHPSTITYNTLINGLCKAGRTSEADEFSKGIFGDTITYSTLLDGYIKEENAAGILETKRRLEAAGVCIDAIMCNILIKALFLLGLFEDAVAMYKGMPDIGLVANAVTYCTIIGGYCKAGRIGEALEIFDVFRGTSISSAECYNCMIHGLCSHGMTDLAVEVFIELHERGFSSDAGIHTMLMKSMFAEKGEEGVVNFVYRIENSKDIFDTVSDDAISFLCKRGFLYAACDVYVLMKSKGSVTKSTSDYSIMKALNYYGKEWLVLPLLNTFVKTYGIVEPEVGKLLVHYLCMKDVNNALRFLELMTEKKISIVFSVGVLRKLVKDGRALDAYKLVIGREENLPPMDVVDYSMVIDGLCKGGKMRKALDLCIFAKRKGITLSIITYNSVINGLRREGCFVEAFRLFNALEKIDMFPTEITYATLIDTLSKEGSMLDARKLLESMILKGFKPNTRVYNSLIDGYCKQGQREEALKLLLEMEEKGLKPDEFTVSSVINGYCQKGDMEGALQFFFECQEKSLLPDFLGFMYLMRGLCAKGRMEECRNILRVMLQIQSILDLLKTAETEVQTESIEDFVVSLCEQGSIREAILVLNEVGSIFFPAARKTGGYNDPGKVQKLHRRELGTVESEFSVSTYGIEKDSGLNSVEAVNDMVENVEKEPLFPDFDSYYATIASLCSRGELDEANKIARTLSKSEKIW